LPYYWYHVLGKLEEIATPQFRADLFAWRVQHYFGNGAQAEAETATYG